MEEDKILRDNKIPGCDELTKPEEIKALSKYLRKIKDVQSEHTTLQKDNLEVPGRTTGRIPKISELPNTVETIDGRTKKVDLSKQKVNIPNQREGNLKLSNYKKNLEDDRELHLSNTKERIRDDRDITLSNQKESIIDGRNTKLLTVGILNSLIIKKD